MNYSRTKAGFILKANLPIGSKIKYDDENRMDNLDEVIAVGNNLKTIIQVGDLIAYYFTKKHSSWLIPITKKNIKDIKQNKSVKIAKIYIKKGDKYIESIPKNKKYLDKNVWFLWEKNEEGLK